MKKETKINLLFDKYQKQIESEQKKLTLTWLGSCQYSTIAYSHDFFIDLIKLLIFYLLVNFDGKKEAWRAPFNTPFSSQRDHRFATLSGGHKGQY